MNVMFDDEDSARLYSSSAALTASFGSRCARAIGCHFAQLDAAYDLSELCSLPGVRLHQAEGRQVVIFRGAGLTVTGDLEAASSQAVHAWTFVIAHIAVGAQTKERSVR